MEAGTQLVLVCEECKVESEGRARGWRALLTIDDDAAVLLEVRALTGWVPLREALALVVLYAAEGDPRFGVQLGRLPAERPELTIPEIQFAAAALQSMPTRPDSAFARSPT